MTTERRFCRFSTASSTSAFSLTEIPPDGICLSAFLVVRSAEHPTRVLLGRINPDAPWDHLGALDPERVAHWKDRWMLPASHLIFRESPQEAAERIRVELTGLSARELDGPRVVSDVYAPPRHPTSRQHWDLEFIFRTDAREEELRPISAWSRLEFLDPRSLGPEEVARLHDDVISHAGSEWPAPGASV